MPAVVDGAVSLHRIHEYCFPDAVNQLEHLLPSLSRQLIPIFALQRHGLSHLCNPARHDLAFPQSQPSIVRPKSRPG